MTNWGKDSMKKAAIFFSMFLPTSIFFATPYWARASCGAQHLRETVEVGPGPLSLADLLPPGGCARLYQVAARVSLGAAPRAGSERVLDGRELRREFEQLEDRAGNAGEARDELGEFPERIVVRLAEKMKSCAEVAEFLAGAGSADGLSGDSGRLQDLNCSSARKLPESAALDLMKTGWNPSLRRWEFAVRCVPSEPCVPFLVWARAVNRGSATNAPGAAAEEEAAVKRGQTATLTWDEAGIRVVLPVICLEAGRIGQSVLVRLENGTRTLRAEVVGTRAVRASL